MPTMSLWTENARQVRRRAPRGFVYSILQIVITVLGTGDNEVTVYDHWKDRSITEKDVKEYSEENTILLVASCNDYTVTTLNLRDDPARVKDLSIIYSTAAVASNAYVHVLYKLKPVSFKDMIYEILKKSRRR